MLRVFIALGALAVTAACQAQLQLTPRTPIPVADSKMVIDNQGVSVEILPALRAQSASAESGRATRMVASVPASKFSATSRGVVFNHAMQSYGVLTGEITFKMKGALKAEDAGLSGSEYPGMAKLTSPNVYVVMANSPTEYVALFNRLKARADVEWVEAIVDYSTGLQRAN